MNQKLLTPEQLSLIKEVENPVMRRRFALLYQMPKELQEKFFAEETTNTIWSVLRSKHGLTDSDLIVVSRIVGLIFLGEVPVKDFIRQLVSELRIDQQKAAAIAKDINQEIFQPVRGSLMEVHGIANGESQIANSPEKIVSQSPVDLPQKPPTETSPPQENIPKPDKPLSLEELEAKEMETSNKQQETRGNTPEPPTRSMTPPMPPATEGLATDKARKAREELIERLKKEKENNKESSGINEPKATETAWNGRTIDLTRIPPRRKSPGNNDREPTVHEA